MSFIKLETPNGMAYIRAADVEMVSDAGDGSCYVQVNGNVLHVPGEADNILIDVMRALNPGNPAFTQAPF